MTNNGDVRDNDALEGGARLGLVVYGVVHLLVAYTALRLALGDRSGSASQQGALSTLAQSGLGTTGLVVVALGFGALVVWMAVEAVRGHRDEDGMKRWAKRASSAGRAVVYATLGVTATRKALGEQSGGGGTDTMTAQVMSATGGRYLVGAVGLGVVAVGAYVAYHGIAERFVKRLDSGASQRDRRSLIIVLGKAGHVAKGLALGVIGALFVAAAVQFEPQKSGGLDQALNTLLRQPFGPYLVGAVAVGLIAFGLYCFAWARHHKG